MTDEIQPSTQGYESTREKEGTVGGVPVSGNAASAGNVLDLTVGLPSRDVSEYRRRYGQILKAPRFGGMFLDGRSRSRVDSWRSRHNTDIGAWERCWTTLGPWCAGTVSPYDLFNMPFVRHSDMVPYLRKLFTLLQRVLDVGIGDGYDWLSVLSLEPPYDRFYLTREADALVA